MLNHKSTPSFPLPALVAAAQSKTLVTQDSVLDVAASDLPEGTSRFDARRFVLAVVGGLVGQDYAHTQIMPQHAGRPMHGDVYGKTIQGQAWFVKLQQRDGKDFCLSCHPPDNPLLLKSGVTLRRSDV